MGARPSRAFTGEDELGALSSCRRQGERAHLLLTGRGDGATWTDALEPDGSGRHRVLANCYYCADVAWSPDGRKIAYVGIAQQARQSADGQVHFGIYVAGPNGSHAHLLAEGLNDAWPAWSPDGKRIVFVSTQDRPGVKNCLAGWDVSTSCPTDIYVMNADGTGTRRLTHDPATEYAPAWSPNGQSIAFVRNVRNRAGRVEQAIYVMNADGTDMREVATGTGGNGRPFSWAPEGQQIAFVAEGKTRWAIDIVNLDGKGARTVFSRDGVWSSDPAWSPDGREIAFSSTLLAHPSVCCDPNYLFTVHPDGAAITRLTHDGYGVSDIAWQPLPSRLRAPTGLSQQGHCAGPCARTAAGHLERRGKSQRLTCGTAHPGASRSSRLVTTHQPAQGTWSWSTAGVVPQLATLLVNMRLVAP